MDYPEFRALSPCVATGVVEAQCKSVVGPRLKRGSMHCSFPDANAIIALRRAILSNHWMPSRNAALPPTNLYLTCRALTPMQLASQETNG